jgi:hypothetical protein
MEVFTGSFPAASLTNDYSDPILFDAMQYLVPWKFGISCHCLCTPERRTVFVDRKPVPGGLNRNSCRQRCRGQYVLFCLCCSVERATWSNCSWFPELHGGQLESSKRKEHVVMTSTWSDACLTCLWSAISYLLSSRLVILVEPKQCLNAKVCATVSLSS